MSDGEPSRWRPAPPVYFNHANISSHLKRCGPRCHFYSINCYLGKSTIIYFLFFGKCPEIPPACLQIAWKTALRGTWIECAHLHRSPLINTLNMILCYGNVCEHTHAAHTDLNPPLSMWVCNTIRARLKTSVLGVISQSLFLPTKRIYHRWDGSSPSHSPQKNKNSSAQSSERRGAEAERNTPAWTDPQLEQHVRKCSSLCYLI